MSNNLDENVKYIYTKTIKLKNGRVLHASQYGLKAFRIPVKDNR